MDQAEQLRALVKKQKLEETSRIIEESKENSAYVITITSGKGGVGKTSVAINLAIQLAAMEKKVVIIDADMGLANVEVMLGIRPKHDIGDVMYGEKNMADIITSGPMGIGFISGGSGIHELNNLSTDQIYNMTTRLHELDKLADYVIIDTGAGINDSIMQFVKVSSEVLVVTTPEPTSITDAYAVIKALNRELKDSNSTVVKMISNRVSGSREGEVLYTKLNSVVEKYLEIKLEYGGAIVGDDNLAKGILNQQPVSISHPSSSSVKYLKMLANNIINNEQYIEKKSMASIFTHFITGGLLLKKGDN